MRICLVFAAILVSASLPLTATAQQTPGREISFPVPINWNKQRGVTTYRLQIAGDDRFRDVFLDRRVPGERYVVTGLPSGYYYWRVTSADFGPAKFSFPVRFFVSGGIVVNPSRPTAGHTLVNGGECETSLRTPKFRWKGSRDVGC